MAGQFESDLSVLAIPPWVGERKAKWKRQFCMVTTYLTHILVCVIFLIAVTGLVSSLYFIARTVGCPRIDGLRNRSWFEPVAILGFIFPASYSEILYAAPDINPLLMRNEKLIPLVVGNVATIGGFQSKIYSADTAVWRKGRDADLISEGTLLDLVGDARIGINADVGIGGGYSDSGRNADIVRMHCHAERMEICRWFIRRWHGQDEWSVRIQHLVQLPAHGIPLEASEDGIGNASSRDYDSEYRYNRTSVFWVFDELPPSFNKAHAIASRLLLIVAVIIGFGCVVFGLMMVQVGYIEQSRILGCGFAVALTGVLIAVFALSHF